MKTHKLTPEERFALVMECRSSGMTDYQWCKEHGISTSTLYRWIALFRKNGFPNVPDPSYPNTHKTVKQEVVKLSVMSESGNTPSYSLCETSMNNSARMANSLSHCFSPVAEITGNGIHIRITNDIRPEIACALIKQIGGTL